MEKYIIKIDLKLMELTEANYLGKYRGYDMALNGTCLQMVIGEEKVPWSAIMRCSGNLWNFYKEESLMKWKQELKLFMRKIFRRYFTLRRPSNCQSSIRNRRKLRWCRTLS
jgi:hypothetical protein